MSDIAGTVGPYLAPAVGGGAIGFVAGYAMKKIIKIAMIISGAFFAALMYFGSQGFLTINWDKMTIASQGALNTLVGPAGMGNAQVLISNLGVPLTGGFAAGFVFGFMRG